MTGLLRTACIFGAFILGALFPQMATLAFLLKYLVMFLLFLAFLTMPLSENPFSRKHLWLLVWNLILGFGPYLLLRPFSHDLALLAFITGITPTAIAAPVIMSFIGRDIAFTATAVLVTNLAFALIIPLGLPFLAGGALQIEMTQIVINVFAIMFIPLAGGMGLRFKLPKVAHQVKKLGKLSLYMWMLAIWIMVSKTTLYLKTQDDVSLMELGIAAGISLSLCILNFVIGYAIGGQAFNRESSQALGQKNLMLSMWLSLTYLNPIIAMGPTFYLLFHHAYNGYLVWRYAPKKD